MTSAKTQSVNRRASPSAADWRELHSGGLRILQASRLARLSWLLHGFSTRPGGASVLDGEPVLNLGFTDWDSRENVFENRNRLLHALGASQMSLATLRQFHSDVVCHYENAPSEPCRGDASVTERSGLLLAVQTADCVPILLADTRRRAVAAVHAGWRGTLHRIVQKTIGRMRMQFGTRPEDLVAALGPAIGGCCYEVGTEVSHAFHAQFADAGEWFDELRTGDEPDPLQWLNMKPPGHQPPPKNVRLDLRAANRAQLLQAGVSAGNISVSGLCTRCQPDLFFSYRREGPRSGSLLSVIGLGSSSF
ncbi:MAG TPA: peptidoglycan editing factor PgeF [Candidatus Acidoferrales bacterium]|nr:peptidoglycan editing factor PgeF [Candidatus Acidoferrales bacterium]